MAIGGNGKPVAIGNIGIHEKKNNPDAKNSYGFRNLSDECAAQMPQDGPPPAYKGIVETHPYATMMAGARRTSPTPPPTRSSASRAGAR